jgi:YD repeat-containing protein
VINTIRYHSVSVTITYDTPSQSYGSQLSSNGTEISRTTTVYDDVGRVSQTYSPNGTTAGLETDYFNDKRGLQTQVTRHVVQGTFVYDITTSTVYDAAGRAIKSIDAENHATSTVYDDAGRVTRTNFADGSNVQISYDARGRKITDKDQLGQVTSYTYDDLGRLIAVTLPKVTYNAQLVSPVTQYQYDQRGGSRPAAPNTRPTVTAPRAWSMRSLPACTARMSRA